MQGSKESDVVTVIEGEKNDVLDFFVVTSQDTVSSQGTHDPSVLPILDHLTVSDRGGRVEDVEDRTCLSDLTGGITSEEAEDDVCSVEDDVDRTFLCNLRRGITKKIVGLVIAKSETRCFEDKKTPGKFRCNHSFVIRDSVDDFVNVSCWGSKVFLGNIAEQYRVNDVVEIDHCIVQDKPKKDIDEKYGIRTLCPFQLLINETHGNVTRRDCSYQFRSLQQVPVRDVKGCRKLGEIVGGTEDLRDTHIDILAVVKNIGGTKIVNTKSGERKTVKEVELFDDSCHSFDFVIWDRYVAEVADGWISQKSVVLLCDVLVKYDKFRSAMTLRVSPKTIVLTDPEIDEALDLYNFAQRIEETEKDLSTIMDVFSLLSLGQALESFQDGSVPAVPFRGIIYACISDINIDDEEGSRCIVTRCLHCKWKVDREKNRCANERCVGFQQVEEANLTKRSLELRLTLADQTSGMGDFVISDEICEEFLECDVEKFESLDNKSKTTLKWKFLFERFKFYFKVMPSRRGNGEPQLSVLSVAKASAGEIVEFSV